MPGWLSTNLNLIEFNLCRYLAVASLFISLKHANQHHLQLGHHYCIPHFLAPYLEEPFLELQRLKKF